MAGLSDAFRNDDDARGALRNVGGLLLATGFMLAFVRKSSIADRWDPLALFVTLAAPAVFLYGTALAARRATGETRPWQLVYVVFAVIIAPFALAELVDWIGDPGDSGNSLNVFWIFLVTAALAIYGAVEVRVRYTMLLAGIALIVSWLGLWDELLTNGVVHDLGTLRGLLLAIAAILVALAVAVRMRVPGPDPSPAIELVTAAGLAAVAATGGISLTAIFSGIPFLSIVSADTSWFWDLLTLTVALLLIGFAARAGFRGPGYVGAAALFLFILVAGLDLDSSTPDGTLVGWPLLLAALGTLAVLGSFVSRSAATPPPAGD